MKNKESYYITVKTFILHYSLVFLLFSFLSFNSACQPSIKMGNLLFHVSEEPNAITDVTGGLMIDHVAIAVSEDSVIEAIGRGVVITPIKDIMQQPGHYLIARVRKADGKQSVANARHYLGCAYDSLFLPDNDAIYCSELVQSSFVNKKGDRLFEPIPMSFHDSTGVITPYWQAFYARQGMKVPEGEPGTNPSELARRHQIVFRSSRPY